jgi:acyl-CoA synthetase (AMP-forming)/AMP-acid ligase II
MSLTQILCRLENCVGTAFWTPAGSTSWSRWAEWVEALRGRMAPWQGLCVGLIMEPTAGSFATMAALSLAGCEVCLINGSARSEEVDKVAVRHGLSALFSAEPWGDLAEGLGFQVRELTRGPAREVASEGCVIIFTSGSTGQPKLVRHSWQSLIRPARRRGMADGQPRRWLWTFRPYLYAGLQVFVQCLIDRCTLVIPPRDSSVRDMARLMREAGVNCVSSTPSFWRGLLAMAGPQTFEGFDLHQITLGGEVADQDVLDRLKRLFPTARLIHIYATSELGRCFSVQDGFAGFPADFLDQPTRDGVSLKVEGGELLARSPNATPESAGWVATGDLVERVGDRVMFLGRKSEIINVGGNKVHPFAIEQVIQSVPGVLDARVYARRSSLTGQLVACELAVAEGYSPESVWRDVQRQCAARSAPHERPRFVEFVAAVTLSVARKKIRKGQES